MADTKKYTVVINGGQNYTWGLDVYHSNWDYRKYLDVFRRMYPGLTPNRSTPYYHFASKQPLSLQVFKTMNASINNFKVRNKCTHGNMRYDAYLMRTYIKHWDPKTGRIPVAKKALSLNDWETSLRNKRTAKRAKALAKETPLTNREKYLALKCNVDMDDQLPSAVRAELDEDYAQNTDLQDAITVYDRLLNAGGDWVEMQAIFDDDDIYVSFNDDIAKYVKACKELEGLEEDDIEILLLGEKLTCKVEE